jgi:Ca-activated chloride channel family protein
LSHHGNGHYAYIDSEAEARRVFVEQGAALVVIAKDVKLQVEFNPERVAAYRLVGYENRLLRDQDFNDDKKDAGDMGAGHTVTALYELVPAGQPVNVPGVDPLRYQGKPQPAPEAGSGEWLTVKMRYKDPDGDQSRLVARPLSGEPAAFDQAAEDFRFAASVAAFGLVLRDSKYKGTATLEMIGERAAKALGNDPGGHRREFVGLVEKARRLKKD